jgi:hypothetical protein
MRWSLHGAAGIVTLRCQDASGRWDEIWARLHNQTEVIPTPRTPHETQSLRICRTPQ